MDRQQGVSAATKLFAGGVAGATETFVTYPAEYLKTRRQLPKSGTASFASIVASTYRQNGVLGLYSGCGPLAVSNFLKSGIRFWTFQTVRQRLDNIFGSRNEKRNPLVTVGAGLSAGVAESVLVVTPGETLKTRLIHENSIGHKTGLREVASQIVRNEGVTALWRGLWPVLCKQGTNSAVRFTTFAALQEKCVEVFPGTSGNAGITLFLGACSGIVTVYASMPFDNLKTRLQGGNAGHYNGMVDCAVQTMREEGLRAFWRGTSPRLVRLTLSSAVTFAVYDQMVLAMTRAPNEPRNQLQTL